MFSLKKFNLFKIVYLFLSDFINIVLYFTINFDKLTVKYKALTSSGSINHLASTITIHSFEVEKASLLTTL